MKRRVWAVVVLGFGALILTFQNCGNIDHVNGKNGLLVSGSSSLLRQNSINPSSRANILFIMVDDMRFEDLRYLKKLKTSLIDQGTTSSTYYATTPLCCPSRASTLRGQYAHNTGVLGNGGNIAQGGWQAFRDRGLEESTIATWLKDAGYVTALYGKYLNKYNGPVPPGWTDWAATINRPHSPYNYTLNHNGVNEPHGDADSDYQTGVLTDYAAKFIKANASGRPFFIYLGLTAPHHPQEAPRVTHPKFSSASYVYPSFVKGPAYNEDVSDKHPWLRSSPPLTPDQDAKIAGWFKDRIGSLFAVEESVTALINVLKESGVYDNTYIFFVSDNGYHLGDHRMDLGKNTGFETDIRVPFIVVGPNVKVGYNVSQLIANIDLAPTWAEIARVPVPEFVDGLSFLTLISNNRAMPSMWRKDLMFEHWGADSEDSEEPGVGQPTMLGLRTLNYKYIEYEDGSGEFYNLLTDPGELNNEFNNPSAPRKLERSKRRLEGIKGCAGKACQVLYPLNEEV